MLRRRWRVTALLVLLGAFTASQALAQPAPIVPPELLSAPDVLYPDASATPKPAGDATVVLVLTIGVDGSVQDATVAEGAEPFASRAVEAARTWKFRPATRAGAPVAAKVRWEIVFHEPIPAAPAGEAAAPATNAPQETKPAARATAAQVGEVRVHGARVEPSRTMTLSRAEVRQIPGTFGDPFRAIEVMPGVTPIVSGLPFFFIRGAPPGDVGYFLDGVRVPYLFHVGAGPSVLHPALIDRVDLYPGGYPARFGRYSGGIVSGETTDPAKEAHGEFNVRAFDAGALVETPFADGKGSVLLGGRYSYTAAVLSLFSTGTTLDYWDYQGRATYDLTPKDRIGVLTFGASDYLGQKTATGENQTLFGTEFYRADVRYDHALDHGGTMRTAATFGLDRTRLDNGRFLRDRLLGLRNEITYPLGQAALLRFGTDAQVDSYDIELSQADQSSSQARIASEFPSRADLSLGTRGDVVLEPIPGFEMTPGVRFDLYGSEGNTALGVDPRFSTRTRVVERAHVLTAIGIAHQAPSFVIPVPGFQPGGLKGGLQRAVQESMGVEFELGGATTATATVFHNAFFNLSDALSVTQPTVSGCAPGTFPDDTLGGDRGSQPTGNGGGCGVPRFPPGTVGPDRTAGGGQAVNSTNGQNRANAFEARSTGTAYGLELLLKRRLTSKLGGFFSYTLSRSTRTANGQNFIASFDRTHVLNAAVAYDLGRNWRAGTRVTFYTGLPKALDPTDPGATRLDPFYRVDLRLEKRWQLGKKWWLSFVAEWMNVTLNKESVGTSCTLNGCQETKVGPVTIPSIGLEGGF